MNNAIKGMLYGGVGMLVFSMTLPMTVLALPLMGPFALTVGRSFVAALAAAAILLVSRAPVPEARHFPRLALISLGVVFGFPLSIAFALEHVPASHGAVILGVLPIATSVMAVWIGRERPGLGFWLTAVVGFLLVSAFSLLRHGTIMLQWGDLLLLVAVAGAAVGYVHSARLVAVMSGWQVICWALVIGLIPLGIGSVILIPDSIDPVSAGNPLLWAGFAYLALGSQLCGFFFWNKGLYLGGTARVSQLQLMMPFVTILAAAVIVGEPIEPLAVAFAIPVAITVLVSRNMRVRTDTESG